MTQEFPPKVLNICYIMDIMMNKSLKYVLYIVVPLVIYFIILAIYSNMIFRIGGCNGVGLPFEFYESCIGPGPVSSESWNIPSLILDFVCIYVITGVIFYFLEKRR